MKNFKMTTVKSADPRAYKPSHIRRLDTLSGNQCAFPGCTRPCIAKDGISIVSKICHIAAASPEGPRFDPLMDNDQRRHFDNLILLCDECHTIIDNKVNEIKFPTSLLIEWKKNHEEKTQSKLLNKSNLLINAINAIVNMDDEACVIEESIEVFNINDKITFNNVVRNKYLIEEYKVYYTKISSIYSELEHSGSFKKEKLLRTIKNIYLKIKGRYVISDKNMLSDIRKHSDDIIDDVEEELLKKCDKYLIGEDDISFGISVIMVDAFMRCKILEEPKK